MNAEQHTLSLPEGYDLEFAEFAEDHEERRLLVLKRADGSTVAIFEFSVFGPDPKRIWQIAW